MANKKKYINLGAELADNKESVDLNEIENAYNQFVETNENLDNAYRTIRNVKKRLSTGWSGKAGDKYIAKFDVISDRFDERVKPAKEDYSDYINTVLEGYEVAEEMNTRMSKRFSESNAALSKFES